jgi:hypothetical protein
MEVNITYHCTEWLSLEQIRALLEKGEILVATRSGVLRLFVNFNDRVAAQELLKKR